MQQSAKSHPGIQIFVKSIRRCWRKTSKTARMLILHFLIFYGGYINNFSRNDVAGQTKIKTAFLTLPRSGSNAAPGFAPGFTKR